MGRGEHSQQMLLLTALPALHCIAAQHSAKVCWKRADAPLEAGAALGPAGPPKSRRSHPACTSPRLPVTCALLLRSSSMSDSSCATAWRSASASALPPLRVGATASSSSKNRMAGALDRAAKRGVHIQQFSLRSRWPSCMLFDACSGGAELVLGARWLDSPVWKAVRIRAVPSAPPAHSAPLSASKCTPGPASWASARASSVLPLPGGPCRSTPA